MRQTLLLIGAITAGATLIQGANGLLQALLPLRMQAAGLTIEQVGLVASAYGLGFVAGCFLAPLFVRRVGHIRAFATLAALSAVVALGFTQAGDPWAWAGLRAASGALLAGLFTVIDGWVSGRAGRGNRGRVIALYQLCVKVAMMLSPLGIALGDIGGSGLFMAAAGLMCLSLLPVAGSVVDEPAAPSSVRLDVLGLFRVAPSAIVGAFAVGLMNGPVAALAPLYGTGVGLSTDLAAALLLALQAGSLLLQWPLGWLSDHVDRRAVIAGLASATAALSAVIVAVEGRGPSALLPAFVAWGGVAFCIYAVCVAHACDLVEPGRIVPTVSTVLVAWAAGVMIGPVPAAAAMQGLGPRGLFLFAAGVSLLLALFVLARMLWRRRGPAKGGFADLAPTSAASAALTPRAGAAGR